MPLTTSTNRIVLCLVGALVAIGLGVELRAFASHGGGTETPWSVVEIPVSPGGEIVALSLSRPAEGEQLEAFFTDDEPIELGGYGVVDAGGGSADIVATSMFADWHSEAIDPDVDLAQFLPQFPGPLVTDLTDLELAEPWLVVLARNDGRTSQSLAFCWHPADWEGRSLEEARAELDHLGADVVEPLSQGHGVVLGLYLEIALSLMPEQPVSRLWTDDVLAVDRDLLLEPVPGVSIGPGDRARFRSAAGAGFTRIEGLVADTAGRPFQSDLDAFVHGDAVDHDGTTVPVLCDDENCVREYRLAIQREGAGAVDVDWDTLLLAQGQIVIYGYAHFGLGETMRFLVGVPGAEVTELPEHDVGVRPLPRGNLLSELGDRAVEEVVPGL